MPENALLCSHFLFIVRLDIEFCVVKHFFQNFEGIDCHCPPAFSVVEKTSIILTLIFFYLVDFRIFGLSLVFFKFERAVP